MLEEWKDIKGYEGSYQVSNYGRISSSYMHGRLLSAYKILAGYLCVKLCKEGYQKTALIHRLVAEAFISNSEQKPHIHHKDGNKANNVVSNLEWATHSENIRYTFEAGGRLSNLGINNGRALLAEEDVYDIREAFLAGATQEALAEDFETSRSNISSILHRRTWRHL